MSPLQKILAAYRAAAQTEKEKGSYFEELIRTYFRHEPRFADLYSDVWLYSDWAKEIGAPDFGRSGKDTPEYITLKNIPLAAYDYVVNGKPALEWVMERQSVTTDKQSGITNDANPWATETMGNPKYPLEQFLRVATMGLETMKVLEGLPKLEIESKYYSVVLTK